MIEVVEAVERSMRIRGSARSLSADPIARSLPAPTSQRWRRKRYQDIVVANSFRPGTPCKGPHSAHRRSIRVRARRGLRAGHDVRPDRRRPSAKFGQPEINLGVIPGIGGTQRLTRAIGKSKAMDMILTGRTIDAEEAERSGLVSRILRGDDFLGEVLEIATTISGKSLPVAYAATESVNRAYESTLAEGILFERRSFFSGFALDDQSEGMSAFVEKRPARFSHG